MLAATANGLGTCWVAGDKKDYAAKVAEFLGVPAGFRLVSLITVGYPAEQPAKTKRPLSQVLHWERF
jgi:nitroreductase